MFDGSVPERVVDGLLAVGVLAVLLAVAAIRGLRPSVPALVLGASGAVALEALLERRHDRVRAAWERPVVRGGTVLLALATVGAAVALGASPVLWFVVGGLAGYLLVLGVVTVFDRSSD